MFSLNEDTVNSAIEQALEERSYASGVGAFELSNCEKLDNEFYGFISTSSFGLMGVSEVDFSKWKLENKARIEQLIKEGKITDENDLRLRAIAKPEIERKKREEQMAKKPFGLGRIATPPKTSTRFVKRTATASADMVADKPVVKSESKPESKPKEEETEEEYDETPQQRKSADKTILFAAIGVGVILAGTFVYFKFIKSK